MISYYDFFNKLGTFCLKYFSEDYRNEKKATRLQKNNFVRFFNNFLYRPKINF